MFKKKFKVRIKHYAEDRYKIQYSSYRFIPIYNSLLWWFEGSLKSNIECWTLRLPKLEEAEKLAQSLKSIQDVESWYEKEKAKEKDFYKRKEEYYKTNIPYTTKYFQ